MKDNIQTKVSAYRKLWARRRLRFFFGADLEEKKRIHDELDAEADRFLSGEHGEMPPDCSEQIKGLKKWNNSPRVRRMLRGGEF